MLILISLINSGNIIDHSNCRKSGIHMACISEVACVFHQSFSNPLDALNNSRFPMGLDQYLLSVASICLCCVNNRREI